MWYRKDLKERAKKVLNMNYWKAVLAALIMGVISGGGSSGGSSASYSKSASSSGNGSFLPTDPADLAVISGIIASVLIIVLVVSCISIALSILVFNPLIVGVQKFFLSCDQENASLSSLSYAFSHSYWNIVKIMFFMKLFTFLWSLLFIIPGIIKAYEYRMIPYILAENPEMDSKDVFARTKAMMTGDKWSTFVLDLSFWGWFILGTLTCCILNILYVNPYYYLTNTELYRVLKQKVGSPNVSVDGFTVNAEASDSSQNPYV